MVFFCPSHKKHTRKENMRAHQRPLCICMCIYKLMHWKYIVHSVWGDRLRVLSHSSELDNALFETAPGIGYHCVA